MAAFWIAWAAVMVGLSCWATSLTIEADQRDTEREAREMDPLMRDLDGDAS
jgi:hypothetical protein